MNFKKRSNRNFSNEYQNLKTLDNDNDNKPQNSSTYETCSHVNITCQRKGECEDRKKKFEVVAKFFSSFMTR